MNVLIASLDSFGFLNPCLGIGRMLSARGCTIAVVTSLERQTYVEAQGFRFFHDEGEDERAFETAQWSHRLKIEGQYNQIIHAARTYKPDLVITNDLCLGAFLFKETHRVPATVVGFAGYLYPYRGDETPLAKDRHWRIADIYRIYNEARVHMSFPTVELDEYEPFLLGDLYLLRTLPELVESTLCALNAEKVVPIGPYLWEPEAPPNPELVQFLENRGESRVIYLQAGRLFQSASPILDFGRALRGTDYHIILDAHRRDGAKNLSNTNFFVADHVPFGAVLPHTELLLYTGMTTSFLGCLNHGVPSFILSSGGSGSDVISDAVLQAGIGIVMPAKNCSTVNLIKGVRFLLDHERIHKRVRELSRQCAAFSTESVLMPILSNALV